VERVLEDCRINTIFEGSSEIMRLFSRARRWIRIEEISGAALNSQLPWGQAEGCF